MYASQCPICGSNKVVPFFFQEAVPLLNNVLYFSQRKAAQVPVGRLDFYGCSLCGFAWNNAFDESLVHYDANYENNQSVSVAFKKHLEDILLRIKSLMPYSFSVLEIGCGQGYFLDFLIASLGERISCGLGFDPALRRRNDAGQLQLIPAYVNKELLPKTLKSPLLLLLRHLIEHVDNPTAFMKAIIALSSEISAAALETPSLEWIIENKTYFDFYYEHCSIFSGKSLFCLLSNLNFSNINVSRHFGGQYLLGTGSKDINSTFVPCTDNIVFSNSFNDFSRGYEAFLAHWRNIFETWHSQGKKIALWGAGSKGVMFANMIGMDGKLQAVVDINIKKQGAYLPVTALPVVTPGEARNSNTDCIVVMNPQYVREVNTICNEIHFYPEIYNV